MIRLTGLVVDCGVRHAFFTRRGGVSNGLYASLNCGYASGDEAANVERNRTIAMKRIGLPADRLVTCRQVHSAAAVTVESPWRREAAPKADAMATNVAGVALGVLTADCAPVLLCDPVARVIGAAHAGWRGAYGGVVEAAIEAMERLGAARHRIRAGIGPCIGSASYEVGPEFPQPIVAHDPITAVYFSPAQRAGHFLFDLAGYVEHRLTLAGVPFVEHAPYDTFADEDEFFSYRRARRRNEPAFGLGLSLIVLDG
jgi:purine-nucleoside/S-methyl-5'-thioadenosine phosphorylase / adenosine deaminase